MDMVSITRGQYEHDIAEAKAEALRELVRVCFDEGDAGVVVGGIEIVEVYVFDTIAELSGRESDIQSAALMRQIAAESYGRERLRASVAAACRREQEAEDYAPPTVEDLEREDDVDDYDLRGAR